MLKELDHDDFDVFLEQNWYLHYLDDAADIDVDTNTNKIDTSYIDECNNSDENPPLSIILCDDACSNSIVLTKLIQN